ncbi:MAG: cyclic nucleotide-binding domain-containing protein [Elusimicrobia bacterium]|nr:cyclic nucleotide-binding domain-containing protein [Elusimicrobiota bacterium]
MSGKEIRNIKLFAALGERELNELETISRIEKYSDGDIIFEEGGQDRDIYILVSGEVSIAKKISGGSKTVAVLKAGDIFGEMALFENAPRSASATAINECEILKIGGSAFAEFLKAKPDVGFGILMNIIRVSSFRLRNMDRYFTTLFEIARTIGSLRTLREVAETVVSRVSDSMDIKSALFYSYDLYNDEFVCIAKSGEETDSPVVQRASELISSIGQKGYYAARDIFSPGMWFFSGISHKGKSEGFLAVSSAGEFGWEDRILIGTICNMASPVIANLKMREEEELKKRLKNQKWTL